MGGGTTGGTDRRAQIIDAALGLVQEGGLAGLTQPRVAARLGVRQSHVTYYFPTRDDLLGAVAEHAVLRRIAALAAVGRARTLHGRVTALAEVLVDPEQTRVLLALTQIADRTPALRCHFRTLGAGVAGPAAALLAAAGAEPSPEALALMQTASTGMAVVALSAGLTDRRAVERQLTQLLAALPRARKDLP